MVEAHHDDGENRNVPQFRLKTLFAIVAGVAVLCVLFRPVPKSMAERWRESSVNTEEALIDAFGPPQPVRKDIDESLKEIKRELMPANARWLQWWDPNDPQRFFVAVVVDGKAQLKLDVQIHDDARGTEIGLRYIKNNL